MVLFKIIPQGKRGRKQCLPLNKRIQSIVSCQITGISTTLLFSEKKTLIRNFTFYFYPGYLLPISFSALPICERFQVVLCTPHLGRYQVNLNYCFSLLMETQRDLWSCTQTSGSGAISISE